jgi:hypothetical protein
MSLELWLAYVLASAVLLVIPGPTILTVISYSLAQGPRARLPLVAAVALGDSTALALSLLGLGALLATSALWFTAIKTVGGLYLLYLGIRLLRSGVAPGDLPAPAAPESRLAAVRQHLAGDGAQSQGHGVLRRLPAAVHHAGGADRAATVDPGDHFRRHGDHQCDAVRRVRGGGAPSAGLAAGARRFNLAGGSLLAMAGVWALLARRPA